jgi:hypothetical protein
MIEPPKKPPEASPFLHMLFSALAVIGERLQLLGMSEPVARKTAAEYMRKLADKIDPPEKT